MTIAPHWLSAGVLIGTLALFVSDRVRHDLVALLALLACLMLGLVPPSKAFDGFSDPAVLAVAGVLVLGRAVELSGVAAAFARVAIPARSTFTVRLAALLIIAAILSAFMNNIAALVITMPIAAEIARTSKQHPGVTMMPLAFATILGGMTTLIGTPANLILSSVRQKELGAPFGFFTMSEVGGTVLLVGLAYLIVVGWRLLPRRQPSGADMRAPWRVFELVIPPGNARNALRDWNRQLRKAGARALARFRLDHLLADPAAAIVANDRWLVISRRNQWEVAEESGLRTEAPRATSGEDVTARVVVAHGSHLIDSGHAAVGERSDGRLQVVAAGPRAARNKVPLATLRIAAGDQLFIRGDPVEISRFAARARLLEVDRLDPVPVNRNRAGAILGIFGLAILTIVGGGLSPALAFLGAAVAVTALRLLPASEVYSSIDWSIIVLLAAMIPVGQSFESSGAAANAARMLGDALTGMPLFAVIAAMCSVTLLLSIFLNNVATAIIMGPLAIDAANLLGVSPDAALLAVLIGASADFLTPIGHQNNLLVMGPGGYRFSDYARMGAVMVVLVVVTAASVLSLRYG
jgi:di/tricarboxylate transporter